MRRSRSSPRSSAGRLRGIIAVLAGIVLSVPASATAMTAGNLVINGDGEQAVGDEWTAVQGLGLQARAWTGSSGIFPTGALIGGGTFAAGNAMLTAIDAGAVTPPPTDPNVTINEQRIDLGPDDVAAISTGTVQARLDGYLGGTAAQGDRVRVEADWLDVDGQSLPPQQMLPEVTRGDRGDVSGSIFRVDQKPVPSAARAVIVRLVGTREAPPIHNGLVDNLSLRLIGIPQLAKRFAAGPATTGTPFRLTYEVRNSEDHEAKADWSFADQLPAGLQVATASRATSDCPDGRLETSGRQIAVAGSVPAGQGTCRVALDVVASAPGNYASGAEQLSTFDGLRLADDIRTTVDVAASEGGSGNGGVDGPGGGANPWIPELPPVFVPPPPPSTPTVVPAPPAAPPAMPSLVRPALRVQLRVSGSRPVRVGRSVRLRLRVTNPTEQPASRVEACVTLPRGVRLRSSGNARQRFGRSARPCWRAGTIKGGDAWSVTLTARIDRQARSSGRARAAAASPSALARVTDVATVRAQVGKSRASRR